MDAKLKANWLAVSVFIVGLALLIGVVQNNVSSGPLGTGIMLGIVGLGFGGVFVWFYYQPARPAHSSKQLYARNNKQPDDIVNTAEHFVRSGSSKEETTMTAQLRPTFVTLLLLTLLTGLIYPLLVTGIAQAFFPFQANGSLIIRDGATIGSELIGQNFSAPRYFWGRLSATGPVPYNAAASSGSNLGPLNVALLAATQARIAALKAADPANPAPIPVDLVTASSSGLDPHISLAAAEYQVRRVASARGLDRAAVRALVARYTAGRQFGLLGEPRVNVLLLNLALDQVQ